MGVVFNGREGVGVRCPLPPSKYNRIRFVLSTENAKRIRD